MPIQKIPNETLLDELHRLNDELGKTPSTNDMDKHGKYCQGTYRNRFGSWNDAVEQAGLEPNPRPDPTPDEALLDEIRRLTDVLGHSPSRREMNEHGEYSHDTYYKHFDSWSAAVEQAGLKPNTVRDGGPQPIPKEDLLNEIRRLNDELNRTPRIQEMYEHGNYAESTYSRRFGSWNNALREAGLEPNTNTNQ